MTTFDLLTRQNKQLEIDCWGLSGVGARVLVTLGDCVAESGEGDLPEDLYFLRHILFFLLLNY